MIATCQTRIAAYAGRGRAAGDAALDACGELYGRVQRKLFADMSAGHYLDDNGYAGHDDWLQDWRRARTGEFFVLGSREVPSTPPTVASCSSAWTSRALSQRRAVTADDFTPE